MREGTEGGGGGGRAPDKPPDRFKGGGGPSDRSSNARPTPTSPHLLLANY